MEHVADPFLRWTGRAASLAFPGRLARRSRTASEADRLASASARSPWATSTSPILPCETDRSRCQSAFPGSALARRSAMASEVLIGGERARRGCPGNQHVANPALRDGQLALPSGISGVGLGEAFGMAREAS